MTINWLRGGEDVAQERKRDSVATCGQMSCGVRGDSSRGQEGHLNFRSARKKEER